MSNDVTLFSGSNVPAFARDPQRELSAMAKALAGNGDGIKRISIKGNVFRLMHGTKEIAAIEDRSLDVILVHAAPKVGRVWYAKKYEAGNEAYTPPLCWSQDGDTPSEDAPQRQSATCATCEKNVAGSGDNDTRACRFQQRLAVVLANDPAGDVLQLILPATSIFGKEDGDKRPLRSYAQWLLAQKPAVDPGMVVTQLRFDLKSESPKLFFKAVRWCDDDEYAAVKEKATAQEAARAIEMRFPKSDSAEAAAPAPVDLPGARPAATEKPTPKATVKPKPTTPAAAAPAAEEDDGAPPTVRSTAKPSAAAVAKTSLAAKIADWDTDDE